MGFFTKSKDILFEEEEVVEPVKKEVARPVKPTRSPMEEIKKEEVKKEEVISKPIEPVKKEVTKPVNEPSHASSFESERDIFKSDNTFPFLDFDEEEFNNSVSRTNKVKQAPSKPTTNVLEYERKRRIEKKLDYNKTEIREITEKKKFKPSPIISPVYGILNEDYKIEDIKTKEPSTDIDAVRKKAFEPVVEILNDPEPEETYYEETVTVKVKEPDKEREEKVKTIDELLEDTADVKINVDEDKKTGTDNKNEYDEIDEELDEINNNEKNKSKQDEFNDEDTLENDLFDLIDSMYDKREDGDE